MGDKDRDPQSSEEMLSEVRAWLSEDVEEPVTDAAEETQREPRVDPGLSDGPINAERSGHVRADASVASRRPSLSRADWVWLACGASVTYGSFLPWASPTVPGLTVRRERFETLGGYDDVIICAAGVVMLVAAVLYAYSQSGLPRVIFGIGAAVGTGVGMFAAANVVGTGYPFGRGVVFVVLGGLVGVVASLLGRRATG
jgi:hypothetical protein